MRIAREWPRDLHDTPFVGPGLLVLGPLLGSAGRCEAFEPPRREQVKSAEEIMEILEAYDLTGSFRDAAELAGKRRLPETSFRDAHSVIRAMSGVSLAIRTGLVEAHSGRYCPDLCAG